jgi:glycosyltransferase involved in cell wall biosynthesis
MRQDARKLLFSSSKKNIFLTQFHLDCFKKEYGDYFNNSEIIYDPIDKNIFFNKNLERENCVVYAGFLHPLKGVFNLIDFAKQNPSLNIKVYGFFETGLDESIFSNIQNITFFGLKTQLELSEIFNTHKYIFHKPNVIEPFCRMIGEALICGMEPICNDRVGSLIEFNKIGYDIFKQKCNNAEIEFWNLIESL